MRYLITTTDGNPPFLTEWFDHECHFSEGMAVYDLNECKYTIDGLTWNEIKTDML
jgi:hypothetical protein